MSPHTEGRTFANREPKTGNYGSSDETEVVMKRIVVLYILSLFGIFQAVAATGEWRVSGYVLESKTGVPVAGAAIKLGTDYLWTISDSEGRFSFENVYSGEYVLEVSCLGYVSASTTVSVKKDDIEGISISLKENSLAIDEVVVTAQRPKDGLNTSHNLGRDALNHLQMSNMSDISALLPGGKTINPDLTANNTLSLRDGGQSIGNASFGTAVEIDGVRFGNNASLAQPSGVGTRSIAVENIESIEVITGVPSAEYGDLSSGIVKINTRKGRTPVNVTFSVNPKTYQVSASKGIGLKDNSGVLNVSGEWARAVKRLTSPYESYTRGGLTLNYSNTFRKVLRFEAGITGNLGGMNTRDDPDAFTGEYRKERENVLRANTSLTWLLNRPGITNLKFDASANFVDNRSKYHKYESWGSIHPAVHAEEEGYFLADRLPLTYFSDMITDSKELDLAADVKYNWHKRWNRMKSALKAGVQWKASGNVGAGEYYEDPSLAADGYRPRPYSEYPFMHNLAVYAEELLTVPVGKTSLEISAGIRMENVFIRNSVYSRKSTFSPRFNLKWKFTENLAIRGGWGVTEKLPSYYVLYPQQEYRDILTFGFSHGDTSSYVYYTQPYTMVANPDLKWQKNRNSEIGIDASFLGVNLSLVGFYNITKGSYDYMYVYEPYSYNILRIPYGYEIPSDAEIKVDSKTGMTYIKGDGQEDWTPMELKMTDRTFAGAVKQNNGADIRRAGIELTADFPEIKPIRTSFRLDASYTWTGYVNEQLSYYYKNGWSHTDLPGRSYQYVGIYAKGNNAALVSNGKITHSLDANLTAITHIPQIRLIITCRLETALLRRSRNLSQYNGQDYAYTCSETSTSPTGGNIHDGNSYTAIRPVAYMDLDGNIHPFTDAEAADSKFSNLIIKSSNAYTFAQDGYGAYLSANLSVTKEIGDHVSISFFANNFTNSRMSVKSMATGVSTIFTPSFYYGLTCRLKF